MSAIARHLAADLALRPETRIVRLSPVGGDWELTCAAGQSHSPFDFVIVSLPAPQSADLLGDHVFAAEARVISMQPCLAVLAAFERRIEVEWGRAFVLNSPMDWVARNSFKPGRASSPDCWVFHATPDWSAARLNLTRDQLMTTLLGEFARITSAPPPPTIYLDAHRWL